MASGRKAAITKQAYAREQVTELSHERLEVLWLARKAAVAAMARTQREGIPFDTDFNLSLFFIRTSECYKFPLPLTTELWGYPRRNIQSNYCFNGCISSTVMAVPPRELSSIRSLPS